MVTPFIYIFFSFVGALFLGFTAVLLKKAHVDNVYYGLIIRALGSGPIIFALVLLFEGTGTLTILHDLVLVFQLVLSALFLICADILLMSILKRKAIGLIAPQMAIFPLFTTTMLIITSYVDFSLLILLYTVVIVFGVILVTYDRSINQESGVRVVPFDKEAILYGMLIALCLGLTNYMDVIILKSYEQLDGLVFTSFKFMFLLFLSVIAYVVAGYNLDDWRTFQTNVTSTRFLYAAGFSAWAIGSLLIYTAYDSSDPSIVNAIIGMNPVFAVTISFLLRMEKIDLQKIIGLVLCVVASIGIVNI